MLKVSVHNIGLIFLLIALMNCRHAVAQLHETRGELIGLQTAVADPKTNLALGRPVTISGGRPYGLTAAGGTDEHDMTDGKFSSHASMWFDSKAVGWSYGGMVHMLLDLGEIHNVREVGIRFQHGAPQDFITAPAHVEVLASIDGVVFHSLDTFDTHSKSDRVKFQLPPSQGSPIIWPLRFTDIDVKAQYIALKIYCSGLTVTDEMWVFGGTTGRSVSDYPTAPFSVTVPTMYTHHRKWIIDSQVQLRNTLGLNLPPSFADSDGDDEYVLLIKTPPGLEELTIMRREEVLDIQDRQDGRKAVQVRIPADLAQGWNSKYWVSFHVVGASPGVLGLTLLQNEREISWLDIPLEVNSWRPRNAMEGRQISVGMTGIGNAFQYGSGYEQAMETLGITWDIYNWPRREIPSIPGEGRKAAVFASLWFAPTFVRETMACVRDDGTIIKGRTCLMTRGADDYRADIESLAKYAASARARQIHLDVESFPRQAEQFLQCRRCRSAFEQSGLSSPAEWARPQGRLWIKDLNEALDAEYALQNIPYRPQISMFAVHPYYQYGSEGELGLYQCVWAWDLLHPEYVALAAPDIYGTYEGFHFRKAGTLSVQILERTGNAVTALWLSPGDAGTLSLESLFWISAESLVGGGIGLLFWSGRTWDAEMVLSLAMVLDALAPFEDVILAGKACAELVAHEDAVRTIGRRLDGKAVYIVEDYDAKTSGKLRCSLVVDSPSRVLNLRTGAILAEAKKKGRLTFDVDLGDSQAMLIGVAPH